MPNSLSSKTGLIFGTKALNSSWLTKFFKMEKSATFKTIKSTCVLFRTHSISEVRFFRETNYDAGTF